MSFGCVGARTYIGMTPGEMVVTVPIQQFPSLVERLEIIVSANAALAPFHQQQKATFGV
jgi:uncharacterized protein (DUF169 family)